MPVDAQRDHKVHCFARSTRTSEASLTSLAEPPACAAWTVSAAAMASVVVRMREAVGGFM